jgi:pimeloyl-ACP methyl ester carboxylesterase
MEKTSVPPRPGPRLERIAMGCFLALSPRLAKVAQPEPPMRLAPFENLQIPRLHGPGTLAATWYPAEGRPRGAVLLLPPWMIWGRAYFNLRGRIPALRAAGYHAFTLDFGGFGTSGPPTVFFDRDVEAALDLLHTRAAGLPLHIWGVSSGGYWAHPVLSRTQKLAGAFFEDVSPHLFEWSWRMAPLGRPGYVLYRAILAPAHRYLDIRRHAGSMSLGAVTYVSGERDKGVRPEDTRALAAMAGGRSHVVAGAEHLGAIKVAGDEVIALALDTFERAEALALSVPAVSVMPELQGPAGSAAPDRSAPSSCRSFRRAPLPLGGERSRAARWGRRLQAPGRHERP